MKRAPILVFIVTCAIAIALPLRGAAKGTENSSDSNVVIQQDAVVHFGQPQPQPGGPPRISWIPMMSPS
jgi:hypothetical protein